jgi:hypothetical protein
LIELLAIGGDRTGAIRQYRELVALFDRELGSRPAKRPTCTTRSARIGWKTFRGRRSMPAVETSLRRPAVVLEAGPSGAGP